MFNEHAMTFPVGQFVPAPEEQTMQPLVAIGDEIVTPEQFFTYSRSSAVSWTGERGLLLAVLEEAVANFLRYKDASTTRGKRLFREEYEWFWSNEKNYLYAFETICDHLHLDPEYIRAGLQRCRRVSDAVPVVIETGRFAASKAELDWRARKKKKSGIAPLQPVAPSTLADSQQYQSPRQA